MRLGRFVRPTRAAMMMAAAAAAAAPDRAEPTEPAPAKPRRPTHRLRAPSRPVPTNPGLNGTQARARRARQIEAARIGVSAAGCGAALRVENGLVKDVADAQRPSGILTRRVDIAGLGKEGKT